MAERESCGSCRRSGSTGEECDKYPAIRLRAETASAGSHSYPQSCITSSAYTRLSFMPAALDRRSFLEHALAAPFFIPAWQPAPPGSYTAELAKLMRAAPVPGA